MGNAKEPLMHAINLIKTDGQAALVEWAEGGIPHRRIVPAAAIFDNACPPEVLDEGIPYGLAWSDLVELSASATALEENLHKAGIWTGADLLANVKAAYGALQATYGVDLAHLIKLANDQRGGK